MDTDTLIRALGSQLDPAPRSSLAGRIALALLGGLLGGLVLLFSTLGIRPDLAEAAIAVLAKAAFSIALAGGALAVLTRAARPGGGASGWTVLAAVAGAAALVSAVALALETPGDRMAAFTGGGFPWCLVLIPAYALPSCLGLVWALRDAAPTRLTLAGATAGAVAGAIGALVYAGFCPVDSVPFVATWYVAGIAVTATVGALLGRTVLRW